MKSIKELFLRFGIGSFFLTNSITAWTDAGEFVDILGAHPWLTNLVSTDLLVKIIGVNDAVWFLLLISGKWRKVAAIWGMIWVAGVIYLTGFAWPDVIERLGIIALLAYYYNLDEKM